MEVEAKGAAAEEPRPGGKTNMKIDTTQTITVAAGMTPHTLTAGGSTAAATETIGPGPTNRTSLIRAVCSFSFFLV
jgi:hypothetical protein